MKSVQRLNHARQSLKMQCLLHKAVQNTCSLQHDSKSCRGRGFAVQNFAVLGVQLSDMSCCSLC